MISKPHSPFNFAAGIKMYVFILLLIGMSQSLRAQEAEIPAPAPKKFIHDIGIAAGFTTGVGLAYRMWYSKVGAQLVFIPIHTNQFEFYSTGLSFMFTLHSDASNRFFLYQGNHYMSKVDYHEGYTEYQYSPTVVASYSVPDRTESDKFFNNGVGFGYDFFENEGKPSSFGFSLQTGIAAYRNFTRANFTGEASLWYKFR